MFAPRQGSACNKLPSRQKTTALLESNGPSSETSAVLPLKQLVARVVDQMFPEASDDCNPSGKSRPHTLVQTSANVPLATLEDLSPMVTMDMESALCRATRSMSLDFSTPRLQPVEEGSDTDSLLSTGTGGTLDERQIDCLLLDRVLEKDYQEVINSCKDSNL